MYNLRDINISPVIGAEVEFYLNGKESISMIKSQLGNIQDEFVKNQYELIIPHSLDIEKVISQIHTSKCKISEIAQEYGEEATFKSKPFEDSAGNGMHIHLSLLDEYGENIFNAGSIDENIHLLDSIGGLCKNMLEDMRYFITEKSMMERFKKYDIFTPTCVSWGINNRSTAIRIPYNIKDKINRHIEYRVPGSDCDPRKVIERILSSVYEGIQNNITPPKRIYGIAYDLQYKLTRFVDHIFNTVK